jgi:uncharacterized protein YprB with RNaseH-like and TPR domain
MSSLADRLRKVVRPHEGRPEGRPLREDGESFIEGGSEAFIDDGRGRPSGRPCAAEVLGGEWRELRGQRFLVIDRRYPPGHRHGAIAVADTLPPEDGAWSRFPLLNGPRDGARRAGRMLFIDLETTGLAGGAGTYAFLVGCAWYQDGGLRVRQFFLSSFSAERILLEAVAETAGTCGAVVTYNGKSFDLPLIETRFLLHRLEAPFAGVPHVDMLHPARRLWRQDAGNAGEESSCRLSALEETLCGHTREGDVPGFEIPSRYFHFVRTGDPRGLAAVMEHNRLDLVSLAMLTALASQLLEDGPAAARTAREALGMGRLYERVGMTADARAAFLRAAGCSEDDPLTCTEAWRAYAVLSRRERQFTDAAHGWRRLLAVPGCPPALRREASEALAVHHEHRLRDLQAARAFALQSLNVSATRARQEATEYRLARLDRKLLGGENRRLLGHTDHTEPQRPLFAF